MKAIAWIRGLLIAGGLGCLVVQTSTAAEVEWPSQPIKLLVPYPPGGAADATARTYADEFSKRLKQPVVVENRPGAGTAIAAEALVRSAPNGYTLALMPSGTFTILPHLVKELRFDFSGVAPIGLLAYAPTLIAVTPSLSVRSLPELIALAKSKPDKLTYSTAGKGTPAHLAGEYFTMVTGTKMLHVPFNGSAPAMTALLGGHVDMAFDSLTVLLPQIKAGKVIPIAYTSGERSPLFPDIPTVAEMGYPGYEVQAAFGLAAPAGTPNEIVRRLNDEIAQIAREPGVKAKLAALSLEPLTATPEQYSQRIRSDYVKFGEIIKNSGMTMD